MKFHLYIILAVIALGSLSSCGESTATKNKASPGQGGKTSHPESADAGKKPESVTPREKNVLFIVMGGFGSCRFDDDKILTVGPDEMEMAKAFSKNFSDLEQQGFKVQTIHSCFGMLTSEKVHYVISTDPNKIHNESLDTYMAEVESAVKVDSNRSVYFMGHSYGGWLAMTTALKNQQNHKYAGVFTIDPISRIKCSSMTYLSKIFTAKDKLTNLATYPGCDSAPQDFTDDAKVALRQSTNYWTNFYQSDFKYLHSSAIADAGRNLEFEYPADLNPHTAIARDQRVWMEIRSAFNSDFAAH